MSLTVEDLKPKPFKIKINGVELTSQPIRLSQALVLTRVGKLFEDSSSATKQEIKQAEADIDEVFTELMPELKDAKLDSGVSLEIISQLMDSIQPSDNKELKKRKVKFDTDPKALKTG